MLKRAHKGVARGAKRGNLIKHSLVEVLKKEADSIYSLVENMPSSAILLVDEILKSSGRVVFSGMGKSGHVGRKLVATFASMGIPALFLHPSEALHGDLGMVQKDDFFIALSKSGTGKELEQVIQVLQRQGNKTSLICCNKGFLSHCVDIVVSLPFKREACELNLAPTSSSTLMIAFGDALAVVISSLQGFGTHDFARTHPSGALGKKLLATVSSFMYTKEELPFIAKDTSFSDVIVVATNKKLGVAIVVDEDGGLQGIVTDGDLRRACQHGPKLFEKTAQDIMSPRPKMVSPGTNAYAALTIMEEFNITSLVVSEDERVVGLVHIHDLIKAGLKS